jgi:hypothetical protein
MTKRAPKIDILRAFDDPNLFGQMLRRPETWAAWRAFLAALFALPMSAAEQAVYRECTGRAVCAFCGLQ